MRLLLGYFYLIGSLIVGSAAFAGDKIDAEDTVRQLVVVIKGELKDAPTMGAGFIFRRETGRIYIATANHVVRRAGDAKNLKVKLAMFPENEYFARLTPHFSKQLDLAVIVVDGLDKGDFNPCQLYVNVLNNSSSLKRGGEVFHIGHPHGIEWLTSVSPDQVVKANKADIIFQTSSITVGHSGGVLLDGDMKIVGMITSISHPYGRALGMEKINESLKEWGYSVQLYARYPPLYTAASEGDLSAVRRIVEEDCTNINEKFYFGYTDIIPIEAAINNDHKDIVLLLLEKGADTTLDENRAIQDENHEMINLLVKHGVDPSTGLFEAVLRNKPNILKKLLLLGAKPDWRIPADGRTVLQYAIETSGNPLNFANIFLEHGANIETPLGYGQNVLHITAEEGHVEIVEKMLSYNPNLDSVDNYGDTPLHWAFRGWVPKRQLKIIDLLLISGADANIANNEGNTVLHDSIQYIRTCYSRDYSINRDIKPFTSLIRNLLSSGANPNARNNNFETPLHMAVKLYADNQKLGLEIIKLLIDLCANVNIKNKDSKTPYDLALEIGFIRDRIEIHGDGGEIIKIFSNAQNKKCE